MAYTTFPPPLPYAQGAQSQHSDAQRVEAEDIEYSDGIDRADSTRNPIHRDGQIEGDSQDIASLAYQLWIERGSPYGSPDEDWFRAEEALKSRDQVPRR